MLLLAISILGLGFLGSVCGAGFVGLPVGATSCLYGMHYYRAKLRKSQKADSAL